MSRDKISSNKILCFIPMKNCGETIDKTLQKFDPSVIKFLNEILVIDNASSDQSVQKAKEALKKIDLKSSLFQNSRNYGLGGSHKIAFKYAYDNGFDYILVVHGDNSVDVKDFKTWLENEKFIKYDMILSTRFAAKSQRVNYPFHRLFGNFFLNCLASFLTMSIIKDFTSGPMNLYRVNSFINKFENPIKIYPNEVTFAQYLLLFGIYRKMDFCFQPVNLRENDKKIFSKMISQFGKAVILLLKSRIIPGKILKKDVFGTYFGHTFRKINIKEEVEDLLVKPEPSTVNVPNVTAPEILAQIPVSKLPDPPIKKSEVTLIDLKRLPHDDSYLKTYENVDFSAIESCEVSDESFLHVKLSLDVDSVLSKGLKSFFLRLFKIYTPKKIILDLNADRVLNSRQCFEFISFCHDFDIDVHMISNRSIDPATWEIYSKLVSKITLGYEYGSMTREEFYEMACVVSKNTSLRINILSHPEKFYHCLGLKKQLEGLKIESLVIQPYESRSGMAEDHTKFVLEQNLRVSNKPRYPERYHYLHSLDEAAFHDSRKMGFSKIIPGDLSQVKIISVDERGNISLQKSGKSQPIGSLYEDSSRPTDKIMELT